MKHKLTKMAVASCAALAIAFTVGSGAKEASAATKHTYYAKAETVLYKSKSTKSQKISYLNQNQKFTTTTSVKSPYYKVKIGTKTGYIPKSKVYKQKTWDYYANKSKLIAYKTRSFQSKFVYLPNKKGTKFESHETPTAFPNYTSKNKGTLDLQPVMYKGKKYYIAQMYLNINPNANKARAYFPKLKQGYEYNFQSTSLDTYTFYNKASADKVKKKLTSNGFVQVSPKMQFFKGYTYSYQVENYGRTQYHIRVHRQ